MAGGDFEKIDEGETAPGNRLQGCILMASAAGNGKRLSNAAEAMATVAKGDGTMRKHALAALAPALAISIALTLAALIPAAGAANWG